MSKVTTTRPTRAFDVRERLRLFDAATRRQAERHSRRKPAPVATRGWVRDDLYDRDAPGR
jgi:hypothetical protein